MIPRNLPGNFYDPTKNLDVSSYLFFGFSKINFALEKVKKGTFSMLLIYHLMQDLQNIFNLPYAIINSVQ